MVPSHFNNFMYSIDNDFDNPGMPSKVSVNTLCGFDDGRPKRGIALSYRRSLNIDCDLHVSTEHFMFVVFFMIVSVLSWGMIIFHVILDFLNHQ